MSEFLEPVLLLAGAFLASEIGYRLGRFSGPRGEAFDEQLGTIQSAFMWGYILTSPIFGYLGDRVPLRRLVAAGAPGMSTCRWSPACMSRVLRPLRV